MPALPVSLSLLPYVDIQGSLLEVGMAMSSSNLIRIKDRHVQKLGGCAKLLTTLFGTQANALIGWSPLISVTYNVNFFSYNSGTGVVTIRVTLGSGFAVGQEFSVQGLTGTGSINSANGFFTAIAGTSGAQIVYQLATGLTMAYSSGGTATPTSGITPTFLTAIGSVGGLEVNDGVSTTHDITPTTWTGDGNWTLTLWGTWLLAYSEEQTIYYWIPTTPLSGSGRALPVSGLAGATGVPTAARGGFVAGPQQQAFAFRIFSATLGAEDPLLIAWCDIANLQDWTVSTTNQAGSFRLSSGSLIIDGTWFGVFGLVWTDIELWMIQYINFPLVYSFNRVGQNCGLIAPQAWASLGTLVAWMGANDFYSFQGGPVRPIPCSVRDFVFNNLDRSYLHSVHCEANSFGNEFKWRFPTVGSGGVANAYAKWNPAEEGQGYEEGAWDIGYETGVMGVYSSSVTNAWCDQGSSGGTLAQPTVHPPLGVDYNGNLLEFEFSGSSVLTSWNGDALDSYMVTGWFYIAEGQEMVTVERVNPNFIWSASPLIASAGTATMTFYFADEIPADQTDYPVRTYGPFTVTPSTPFIIVRGRGRAMQIRIDCQDAGTYLRSGKHLARVTVDGRR